MIDPTTPDGRARAIEIAMEWLVMRMKGITRKGGDRPAIVHSLRVGFSLDQAGQPFIVVVAGFLHDLVEDTDVTLQEIEATFGKSIALLVEACSHDNELHERDREAANEDLFRRAETHGASAIAVKVADAADNIETVQDLPEHRRRPFMERANRWLTLGRMHLGPEHPLTKKLQRRYRRAKERLAQQDVVSV